MTQDMTYKIAALYKFVPVEDIPALRAEIQEFGKTCEGMCGTLLIAPEGVNGTIAAMPEDLDRMIDFLDSKFGIKDVEERGELKYSSASEQPFNKFKVRPKKEIITMREPEAANPNVRVGTYVKPKDWNAVISDPEVKLIDTRNEYETRVGVFEGTIDPKIEIFTEFGDWVEENLDPEKDKKIAMFCTGGIRCEKASAYMLSKGFETVYHLKGGILQYLEEVPEEQSKWDGECFVFDHRVSVGHGLKEGDWEVCHACREPLSAEDVKHPSYEPGISCHHCIESLTPEREKSLRARQQHYAAKKSA